MKVFPHCSSSHSSKLYIVCEYVSEKEERVGTVQPEGK